MTYFLAVLLLSVIIFFAFFRRNGKRTEAVAIIAPEVQQIPTEVLVTESSRPAVPTLREYIEEIFLNNSAPLNARQVWKRLQSWGIFLPLRKVGNALNALSHQGLVRCYARQIVDGRPASSREKRKLTLFSME